MALTFWVVGWFVDSDSDADTDSDEEQDDNKPLSSLMVAGQLKRKRDNKRGDVQIQIPISEWRRCTSNASEFQAVVMELDSLLTRIPTDLLLLVAEYCVPVKYYIIFKTALSCCPLEFECGATFADVRKCFFRHFPVLRASNLYFTDRTCNAQHWTRNGVDRKLTCNDKEATVFVWQVFRHGLGSSNNWRLPCEHELCGVCMK